MFDKYGVFNILDDLSGGDVLKWDDVLNTNAQTILIKLMMNSDKRKYSKRVKRLIEAEQKRK